MGGRTPLKNSNIFDFYENKIIYVKFPEEENGGGLESLGAPVRELWGAEPPLKIQIYPIVMKFK